MFICRNTSVFVIIVYLLIFHYELYTKASNNQTHTNTQAKHTDKSYTHFTIHNHYPSKSLCTRNSRIINCSFL